MSAIPRTQQRIEDTEVSELLALTSWPARAILGLFIASTAIFTFGTINTLNTVWPSIVAMVLVSGGSVVVLRPHSDPFPMSLTLVVVGVVAASTTLVSWQLPADGSVGRAAWHLGANTWLLFFLALRRRPGMAWVAFAMMTGITIEWAILSGRGYADGANMLRTHAGILVVGTLFASSLRRTARRINLYNDRAMEAAVASAATDASASIREQRVAELAAIATPLLATIAEGGGDSEAERLAFKLAEAELRDSVRGRSLAIPAVADAAREARARGVEVTLLDDRGSTVRSGDTMQEVRDTVVQELQDAERGAVTVRLLPAGRPIILSVVVDDGQVSRRIDLADKSPAEVSVPE